MINPVTAVERVCSYGWDTFESVFGACIFFVVVQVVGFSEASTIVITGYNTDTCFTDHTVNYWLAEAALQFIFVKFPTDYN